MKLDQITPLVLTYNEQANIEACLAALSWARRIIVVDSGSTDCTAEIVRRFTAAELHVRAFDNHPSQWNHGLGLVETPWVLTLDADYICPSLMSTELLQLPNEFRCYQSRFQYCVFGRPLRGTLYPPRIILFPACEFRYCQDGHTQMLNSGGHKPEFLRTVLLHNDLKPLGRWLESQAKYARLEAEKINLGKKLTWKDKIRKTILIAPVLTLFYCLFAKGLIFDGWRGLNYSFQRVYAELLLSLNLLDHRLRSS